MVATGVVAPAPVLAAPLGMVKLSQSSGTVDATPIFRSASASAPCPAGFGRDALLRVGRPGGPFTNLARPLSAGGYDRAPVTATPNRSFVTALGGGAPIDGEWWVVVECYSQTEGMHPDRFVTPITVSGRQWRSGRPAGSASGPGVVAGAAGAAAPPTVTAAPPDSGLSGTNSPTAVSTPSPRLAGNARTGVASLANVWWVLALVGVLAVVGVTRFVARRPGVDSGGGRRTRRR